MTASRGPHSGSSKFHQPTSREIPSSDVQWVGDGGPLGLGKVAWRRWLKISGKNLKEFLPWTANVHGTGVKWVAEDDLGHSWSLTWVARRRGQEATGRKRRSGRPAVKRLTGQRRPRANSGWIPRTAGWVDGPEGIKRNKPKWTEVTQIKLS